MTLTITLKQEERSRLEIKTSVLSVEMRVWTRKGNETARGEWPQETSTDRGSVHRLHNIADILRCTPWKMVKMANVICIFLPWFFEVNLKSRHASSKIKTVYLSKNKNWIRGPCKYLRDWIQGAAREEGGRGIIREQEGGSGRSGTRHRGRQNRIPVKCRAVWVEKLDNR